MFTIEIYPRWILYFSFNRVHLPLELECGLSEYRFSGGDEFFEDIDCDIFCRQRVLIDSFSDDGLNVTFPSSRILLKFDNIHEYEFCSIVFWDVCSGRLVSCGSMSNGCLRSVRFQNIYINNLFYTRSMFCDWLS